jgi:hypothetical protein
MTETETSIKADPKTIDRIRKLLARSRSDNMHEAQTSADMAHKMMAEHGLTMADIDGENSPIGEHIIESDRFMDAWRWGLLTASAWRFYGHTVRIEETFPGTKEKKIFATIIANKTDLIAIIQVFVYFENAIDGEWERRVEAGKLHGQTAIESFKRGAVVAVQERLLSRVENDLLKTRRDTLSMGAMVLVRTKVEQEAAKAKVAEKYPKAYKPQMFANTLRDVRRTKNFGRAGSELSWCGGSIKA